MLHPVVLPPRRSAWQNHGLACRQVASPSLFPSVRHHHLLRLSSEFVNTTASSALSCATSLPLRLLLILTAQCRLPLLAAPSSPTSLSYAVPSSYICRHSSPPLDMQHRRAPGLAAGADTATMQRLLCSHTPMGPNPCFSSSSPPSSCRRLLCSSSSSQICCPTFKDKSSGSECQ
jgi:hypothetical protein